MLFEDSAHNAFLWDENSAILPVPGFTGPLETAVWALDMPGLFALSDVLQLHLYTYLPDTLAGPGKPLLCLDDSHDSKVTVGQTMKASL